MKRKPSKDRVNVADQVVESLCRQVPADHIGGLSFPRPRPERPVSCLARYVPA